MIAIGRSSEVGSIEFDALMDDRSVRDHTGVGAGDRIRAARQSLEMPTERRAVAVDVESVEHDDRGPESCRHAPEVRRDRGAADVPVTRAFEDGVGGVVGCHRHRVARANRVEMVAGNLFGGSRHDDGRYRGVGRGGSGAS